MDLVGGCYNRLLGEINVMCDEAGSMSIRKRYKVGLVIIIGPNNP